MIQKIALFRALYLGDMLLAVPAWRALRQHFPHAEITLIGLPWAATFAERYPEYLDRFVAFKGYPGLPEVESCSAHIQAFIEAQRGYHYDLAIQMHGNGRNSNAFLHELQTGMTVGYFPAEEACKDSKLTISAPYPVGQHEIERNLSLVRLLGATRLDTRLEFPLWAEDFQETGQLLEPLPLDGTPWIGLHIGAKHPARCWPPAYFAELADRLAHRLHASIILTGGTTEQARVQQVSSQMAIKPLNLAGQTSLGGLAALLSTLDLFISSDTGPAHLAYALDTPSLTFFGPTDYQRWRPLAQQRHQALRVPTTCSPCAHQVCPIDHRCLKQLRPALVEEAVIEYLQNTSISHHDKQKMSILL